MKEPKVRPRSREKADRVRRTRPRPAHVENAQALLERARRQQAAIVKIATHDSLATGAFDMAANAIVEIAAQALGVDRAGIWLLSDDGDVLRCADLFDRATEVHSHGIIRRAGDSPHYFEKVRAGRAIAADDACHDPRTREFAESYLIPSGITSTLDAAIRVSGSTVGVVCLEHIRRKHAWGADEICFAGQIADQVAQVQASRYRRQVEDALRAQRDVGIALGSTSTLVEAVERALEIICRVEGIDSGGFYLVDPMTGDLDLIAHRGFSPSFVASCAHCAADSAPARVVRQGTPVYGSYPEVLPVLGTLCQEDGLRSTAVLPVRYGEAVVACLDFASHSHDEIPAKTRAFLEAVRVQVGGLIGRTMAEQALRDSEAHFRQLAELLPEVIFELDTRGTLTFVNRPAMELTGYDEQDLANGFEAARFFIPEDRERVRENVARVMRGENLGSHDYTVQRRDGTTFPVIAWSRPLTRHGHLAGVCGIVVDISRQKQTEEELRHAKEAAEASSRAKSEFLANMSHEIRTPMNVIIGTSGLLLDTELNQEQQNYVRMIENSGEVLLSLINDILDFSRIEAGQLVLEPVRIDLRGVVEQVADLLACHAWARNLELVVRYDPRAPRMVIGDPGRIRQILTNLLSNAIKFTSRGHVFLNVESVEQNAASTQMRFSVSDTGIGIAPEKLPDIFEKFTQADASTTRKYGGTGLGLAICRQLVTIMRGRIGADSEPGVGSTFWFTLPLDCQTEPPPSAPTAWDPQGTRVLLAMANPIACCVTQEQLCSLGMRCALASTAEGIVHLLQEGCAEGDPFQVAILDQQLPEVDLPSLVVSLHDDPQFRETALVPVCTLGQDCQEDVLAQAAVAERLHRPVLPSRLWSVLAAVLEGRTAANRQRPRTAPVRRPATQPPRPSAKVADTSRARVLIAEDNAFNQRVAMLMLEKLGCRVDVAANGREAVEMLAMFPYDLVFMDCEMPILDGYAATREIRELPERQRAEVPIVAMTAHALSGDLERCLAVGMDDYVNKPITADALRAVLDRWRPVSAGAAGTSLVGMPEIQSPEGPSQR